ncbi:MAG: lipoyl(octanoyl) transferase LipB [Myxococcales bacterium]|nr:lipoyl(octanoyl) transferase LipB [Myxococcales bacterium]MCB9521003.1 lipoyl(octanoyl) transferase LipB [Myxococcales bacterium]MCB9531670.1 lipoyl(octanoyl) transferase LipB [Myxococcales bacterium]MCB9534005.1 lipoyl(octanoyl) transferase LipB [Myxococcales bacterium]
MAPHDGDVRWEHLGRVGYSAALDRQRATWAEVVDSGAGERVFTLEHDPVITVGRRGSLDDLRVTAEQLEAAGVELVETDRGGELTYHGPGQLVIYPILAVQRRAVGASDLVRGLARAIADVLSARGVEAVYDPARPGLWVGGAKICAVGMRISKGVSLHGAAVNVSTSLDAYRLFVPCGLPEAGATSMQELGARVPPLEVLAAEVVERFSDVLRVRLA